MTQVRIPLPTGQVAPLGPVRLSIRLVDAAGGPVLGWSGSALISEYADVPLTEDRVVALVPQSAIALPQGAPTWYAVAIATRKRTERYRVQVPDTEDLVELAALVAAQFSTTNHCFTAPVSGYYFFAVAIWASTVAELMFYVNGNKVGGSTKELGTNSNILHLGANDVVSAYVRSGNTSINVTGGVSGTFFCGFLVSAD